MPTPHPPEFEADAFDCPYCGAYAAMTWVHIMSSRPHDARPIVSKATCSACDEFSIWSEEGELISPRHARDATDATVLSPHEVLPDPIGSDGLGARAIALRSPRRAAVPERLVIAEPVNRMLRFCREEYPYYDGLPSGDPDRIEPLDVLAAVMVNGFYNASVATIRLVHRGLAAACDPLLPAIPRDADLLAVAPPLTDMAALLRAAVAVPRVLIPVATKVLHRKRPNLIPMLDNVVLAHYLGRLPPATQDKARAAGVAVEVLGMFRTDLATVRTEVDAVVTDLAAAGFVLSRVRVLEVLLWTEVEERGYYR